MASRPMKTIFWYASMATAVLTQKLSFTKSGGKPTASASSSNMISFLGAMICIRCTPPLLAEFFGDVVTPEYLRKKQLNIGALYGMTVPVVLCTYSLSPCFAGCKLLPASRKHASGFDIPSEFLLGGSPRPRPLLWVRAVLDFNYYAGRHVSLPPADRLRIKPPA